MYLEDLLKNLNEKKVEVRRVRDYLSQVEVEEEEKVCFIKGKENIQIFIGK